MTRQIDAIIVAWRTSERAQQLVRSIRAHSHGDVTTIVVVNDAPPDGLPDLSLDADVVVAQTSNPGYAAGLNAGLAHAAAPLAVFMNDDLLVPRGWDLTLTQPLLDHADVGAVVPALTAAGLPSTVRTGPSDESRRLAPFEFASGACLAARSDQVRALGGWPTLHGPLGAEDLDLQLQLWVNGLSTWFEGRVLLEHVSKASARHVAWEAFWYRSGSSLLRAWSGARSPALLNEVDPALHSARLRRAQWWARTERLRLLFAPTWWRRRRAAQRECGRARRDG